MFTITGSEARFAILLLDPIKVLKIQLINKNVMNNDKCDLKKQFSNFNAKEVITSHNCKRLHEIRFARSHAHLTYIIYWALCVELKYKYKLPINVMFGLGTCTVSGCNKFRTALKYMTVL